MTMRRRQSRRGAWLGALLLGGVAITGLLALSRTGGRASATENDRGHACGRTSRDMLRSCRYQARSDYWLALGKCENLSSEAERKACQRQASMDLKEALGDCSEQLEAREEVCDGLGEGPYDPRIRPSDFVAGIDNPFLPLEPGTTRIYEGMTAGGVERVEVTVTHNTVEILGVTCVEVRDTVSVGGEVVEDTLDWFAQDREGNVWYFGEDSREIEDGKIINLEGSWKAGVDGAKPGIVMEAHPEVGDLYRQEFFLGEAEDMGEVLSLGESATVPAGSFEGCLRTRDFSPLEPDANEHKIYAPGVGLVLEIDVDSGDRVELVEVKKE